MVSYYYKNSWQKYLSGMDSRGGGRDMWSPSIQKRGVKNSYYQNSKGKMPDIVLWPPLLPKITFWIHASHLPLTYIRRKKSVRVAWCPPPPRWGWMQRTALSGRARDNQALSNTVYSKMSNEDEQSILLHPVGQRCLQMRILTLFCFIMAEIGQFLPSVPKKVSAMGGFTVVDKIFYFLFLILPYNLFSDLSYDFINRITFQE